MPAASITQQPRNAVKHVCLWDKPCLIQAAKQTLEKMLTLAVVHEQQRPLLPLCHMLAQQRNMCLRSSTKVSLEG